MQQPGSMSVARWVSIFLAGWAFFEGIFVGFIGLALHFQIQRLWVPYLLLLWCGFVGAPLIYWARHSRYATPKSGAFRFALVIFVFLNLHMGALLLGAVSLGMLATDSALYGYAPYILPTSVAGSIIVYIMMRQRLETFALSKSDHA